MLSIYCVNNNQKIYEQVFNKRNEAETYAEIYIYDYINEILECANPDHIVCYQRVKQAELLCELNKLNYKIVQIKL